MGFVRTVNQIAKALGRENENLFIRGAGESMAELNPKAVKLFELLQGVTSTTPQEFGRFRNFNLQALPEGTAGVYRPWSRSISVDPRQSSDYFQTFLHELEHSRQFMPNLSEFEDMTALVANSNITDYAYQPIEQMARKISIVAKPNPKLFNHYHNEILYRSPEIREGVEFGKQLLENDRRGNSYWGERLTKDIEHIKPYLGKGWLFSATPLFVPVTVQSGREDS